MNLAQCPLERGTHVGVDIIEIFDEPALITVSAEEGDHLLVIHAAINGSFTDLKAVDVDDGDHSTRLGRVDVLVSVPSTGIC